MNELIKVRNEVIGNASVECVSARELATGFGVLTGDLARWLDANVSWNVFALQGIDFVEVSTVLNSNNVKVREYWLTIDFAKRLAMKTRTAKGEAFRQYFINLEKAVMNSSAPASIPEQNYWAMKAQREVNEEMKLPESGRLLLLGITNAKYGNVVALPAYGVDSGLQTTGSSRPTFSASELLKRHGSPMSIHKFNALAEGTGYLTTKTRPSSKSGDKRYKALTEDGLRYGKNVTSPTNPRETQPHWFEDTFGEFLDLLEML